MQSVVAELRRFLDLVVEGAQGELELIDGRLLLLPLRLILVAQRRELGLACQRFLRELVGDYDLADEDYRTMRARAEAAGSAPYEARAHMNIEASASRSLPALDAE